MSPAAVPGRDVFINCPFDEDYRPLFEAMVFTIMACGYRVRCTLEQQDSTRNRIDTLYTLIEHCDLAIHDISRTELDAVYQLPRFNMPLELGIFLGAKRFGGPKQRRKQALILDRERYRYQKFISDLGGVDPQAHGDDEGKLVAAVRNFINRLPRPREHLPSPAAIKEMLDAFRADLPAIAAELKLVAGKLDYQDLVLIIDDWFASLAKVDAAG